MKGDKGKLEDAAANICDESSNFTSVKLIQQNEKFNRKGQAQAGPST